VNRGDHVVVVHLGRQTAKGEVRRVEGWAQVLEAAGMRTSLIRLLPENRATASDVVHNAASLDWMGKTVPEALSWSWRNVEAKLRRLEPDVVVIVSVRAFHPRLAGGSWLTLLDYVDQLSVSYSDRAAITGNPFKKVAVSALGSFARRAETKHRPGIVTLSAGVSDAKALGAQWFPIVVDRQTLAAPSITHTEKTITKSDVLFVGSLSYEPNVEAVQRLAALWPEVTAQRPEATAVIAGSSPSPLVRRLASDMAGWELHEDFDDLDALLSGAKLAVVPLRHASGMQIKVLDAAGRGVPQIVDPVAMNGFDPDFPVARARDDGAFVREILRLLGDEEAQRREGDAARRHVLEKYCPDHWASWLLQADL